MSSSQFLSAISSSGTCRERLFRAHYAKAKLIVSRVNKPSINLVSKQIYHRIDDILLASSQ